MTRLALHPQVGYGLVDERAVFLDLRRDRYLMLDAARETALRALRNISGTAEEPRDQAEAIARLLPTGLFRQVPSGGNLEPLSLVRPSTSLLDRPVATARWPAILRVWRAVARARRRLATTPLSAIVDAHRRGRSLGARRDGAGIESAAAIFLAARALVPIERHCLTDAIALLDWLAGDARHVRLVFGVRMNPFRAHCWLQTGRVVLTDACDAVAPLVPVLEV